MIVTARQAKRSAKLFNYGTLIAIMFPLPLLFFWSGLSMLVYAMNKENPNEKVGYYTQQAAYRFYGVAGFVIVIGAFFPVDYRYYLVLWILSLVVLVPWTLWDLHKINGDTWEDAATLADSIK